MENQNVSTQNPSELLKKNVNAEPVGVIYNITSDMVTEFVRAALTRAGVDGVRTVASVLEKDGKMPVINTYVVMDPNSKDIISSNAKVASFIKKKLDDDTYKFSDKLKAVLKSFCGEELNMSVHKGFVFAKLNVMYILGLMLAVNPRTSMLNIPEYMKSGKNKYVLTVYKSLKFNSAESGDSMDRILNEIINKG